MQKFLEVLDKIILVIIILSALILGLETDPYIYSNFQFYFGLADIIILSIFVLEIILKLIACGKKPYLYFTDPWNLFDFTIVLISFIPYLITGGQSDTHAFAAVRLLRLFRSFRVFRVLRLVSKLKKLQLIVETLLRSLPSMSYVIILLAIWFYIYAIVGIFFFGKVEPNHFGNLGISFITLFECASGNWTDIMETITEKYSHGVFDSAVITFYFVSFYFVGGLIILNLFIGIIVSELQKAEEDSLRMSYKDDVDDNTFQTINNIANQIEELKLEYDKLRTLLDKNKKSYDKNHRQVS